MPGVKHRHRPLVLGLAASLIAFLALIEIARGNHAPQAPDFPEFSYPYTQRADGNCINDPVDPINILFKGPDADWSETAKQIYIHAGWTGFEGSNQNLRVNVDGPGYECHEQNYQRADGSILVSRFHIRLWKISATTNEEIKKTVGDAHHEDARGCGHAVDENGPTGSGFDWGRRELKGEFADAGHVVGHEEWGNTRNFAQCDAHNPWADRCETGPATSDFCAGWAGSNGNGAVVWMGHHHHYPP